MVSRFEQDAEVACIEAPESWAEFYHENDHWRIAPAWMTLDHIEQQRAVADELQLHLGRQFEVDYSPNSTFGDDEDPGLESMGHVISVGYKPELNVAFDLRDDDLCEQLAAWLAQIAGQFNQARHRLLAKACDQPADDEAVITLFEAIDARTGRVLYRSLVESDCRDFQRGSPSPCEVRGRDALLCSPRMAGGAA